MSEPNGSGVNVEAQDLGYTPNAPEQLLQNYRRVLERIRAAEQDHSGVHRAECARTPGDCDQVFPGLGCGGVAGRRRDPLR